MAHSTWPIPNETPISCQALVAYLLGSSFKDGAGSYPVAPRVAPSPTEWADVQGWPLLQATLAYLSLSTSLPFPLHRPWHPGWCVSPP